MPLKLKKGVHLLMKGQQRGRGRRPDQGAFVSRVNYLVLQWLKMRPDWVRFRHGQGGVRRGRRQRDKGSLAKGRRQRHVGAGKP